MTGKTGEKCKQSGVYICVECEKEGKKNEIPLSKGETFPPCNYHGSTTWRLVRPA